MFNKKCNIVIFSFILITFLNCSVMLAQAEDVVDGYKKYSLDNIFDEYILIGLTELYFGSNKLSGNLETIENVDDFQEKVNKGRASFYLKGKIKGKYLLTVWLDTGEESLDSIITNFGERRVNTPFAKINPDKYYPVYGDNSIVSSDVNTIGKFYLCLSSEEFKAIWGNYRLKFNNNKLINYNRNLYGFNLEYNQILKKHNLYLDTFWYQPFSLHSQDELEITGGMLYYLRHNDLIIGSENLKLELRDANTGRVTSIINLTADIDYDINYLQGRIILKKKVDLLAEDDLIEDENGKDSYYLIADYDYDYNYHDSSNDGYGLESRYQLSEGLYITGNYIQKQADSGQAYQVSGINLSYSPVKNAKLELNWASSQNILSGRYISDDGGLTYSEVPREEDNQGTAWTIDYRQFIGELKSMKNIKDTDWVIYYSSKERGFSSGSQLVDTDEITYGTDISASISKIDAQISYDRQEQENSETDTYTLDLAKKYNEKLDLKGEIKRNKTAETEDTGNEENIGEKSSLTAALGFDYQIDEKKKIYGSQQFTLAKSDNTDKNNLTKLGGEIREGKWSFNAEGTTGSKDSILFGAAYQINENSEIYSTVSKNFTDKDKVSTETTVGTKSKINEDVEIYGEHKVDDGNNETEQSNVLGVDYTPADKWLLSMDYTASEVNKEDNSNINREIIGLGSSYNEQKINFDYRLEYRKDSGNQELEQFIMTGNLSWNYNDEIKVLSEVEYLKEINSTDTDTENIEKENKHIEATIGAAYRPIKTDQLNLIAKYTYLEEDNLLVDSEEDDSTDSSDSETGIGNYLPERAQIFAVDAIYDLNSKWQLAEKLAYKDSEIKLNEADWAASETYLWINRLNYKYRDDIDLFVEYRTLENKQAEDRKSGFLLGGYKKFTNNFKLGAGYNFTDFNDDLTDLSYEAKGWFLNLIKVW